MGFLGGTLGYRLLRYLSPGSTGNNDTTAYQNRSKLEVLFGKNVWDEFTDKVVLDFGCEGGIDSVEIAQHGARRVIGIDLYENSLEQARQRARAGGVGNRCSFITEVKEKADVIITLDSFEHFSDPVGILKTMENVLTKDGYVLACFGPTWFHPLGGHGFSIFPWAHLVFTERAFMHWYGDFAPEKPTCFAEVRSGLNKMTIKRFERIVAASDFRFASFETVPIRRLRPLANRLTREFTTAVVKCRLVRK
jgi:SAM-dependent methyltransferase